MGSSMVRPTTFRGVTWESAFPGMYRELFGPNLTEPGLMLAVCGRELREWRLAAEALGMAPTVEEKLALRPALERAYAKIKGAYFQAMRNTVPLLMAA